MVRFVSLSAQRVRFVSLSAQRVRFGGSQGWPRVSFSMRGAFQLVALRGRAAYFFPVRSAFHLGVQCVPFGCMTRFFSVHSA